MKKVICIYATSLTRFWFQVDLFGRNCEKSVGQTIVCKRKLDVLYFSINTTYTLFSDTPQTKCQKERATSNDPRRRHEFRPVCNEDGSYHKVQCSVELTTCWCVNQYGKKTLDVVDGANGLQCFQPKGRSGLQYFQEHYSMNSTSILGMNPIKSETKDCTLW